MKIFKYELSGTSITTVFSIIGVLFVIILGNYNVKDLREARKAEEVLEDLKELRIALEKYYQVTKKYPDLTREGVKDNLRILDYKDRNGKIISFAEIYGHDVLPKTPSEEGLEESNNIYDTNNFLKGNNSGGWNYDYSGNTGEIHPNLPENIYSQGVEWSSH